MVRIWEILSGMIEFASQYCMDKCARTMLAGMMLLPFIGLIRVFNRSNRSEVNYYSMLLLLLAGISGMNKLFYLPYVAIVSMSFSYYSKPIHGIIYFGVVIILLSRFIWKNFRMKKWVATLPLWESGELIEAVSFLTEEDSFSWQKKYLEQVKVHVTTECISPFSGGLLHPFIVMPARVLMEWPQEEIKIALCHELAHLKSGHIFWMMLFKLLKIYWWANPLIYLCERKFRDDMERVCDEKCVCHAGVSRSAYSRTLLSMVTLMQSTGVEGILCFSGRNDFNNLKKRIVNLARLDIGCESVARGRKCRWTFTVVLGTLFFVILITSYPQYTMIDAVSLYDESLNMLDYDSEELRIAVNVKDGKLVIDQKKFRDIVTKNDIKGEYAYVSFGGIMKVPGAGGGGNTGMIDLEDYSDIFYLKAEGIETDLLEFWLKYLI